MDKPGQEPGAAATDYDNIDRYEGEPAPFVPSVYTIERKLSLTFNGMSDRGSMLALLDELDRLDMKATFFLPGMRVAEEPDVAQAIVERGHEAESNTLTRSNLDHKTYNEIFKEVDLSKSIIEEATGASLRYVRTGSGDPNSEVGLAAAHSGLQANIGYSLNIKDSHLDKELKDKNFLRLYITRGGIVNIDLEKNARVLEMLPYLAAAANEVGYEWSTLDDLMASALEKLPLTEIEGYDAAVINPHYEDAGYRMIYQDETPGKEISITFDDWGTDYTVTKLLDILAEYDIKTTFFLRANGAEANPSLARAIAEEGHEIANHTFSHPVVTTITPEQLQEEIVKAHQALTEAVQQPPVMMFRPPTGAIDDKAARIVAATGYETIAMYDVTVLDWDARNDAETLTRGVLEQAKDGSVILLHMLDDIHTLEALPDIIDGLRAKGYRFVKMSEMLN